MFGKRNSSVQVWLERNVRNERLRDAVLRRLDDRTLNNQELASFGKDAVGPLLAATALLGLHEEFNPNVINDIVVRIGPASEEPLRRIEELARSRQRDLASGFWEAIKKGEGHRLSDDAAAVQVGHALRNLERLTAGARARLAEHQLLVAEPPAPVPYQEPLRFVGDIVNDERGGYNASVVIDPCPKCGGRHQIKRGNVLHRGEQYVLFETGQIEEHLPCMGCGSPVTISLMNKFVYPSLPQSTRFDPDEVRPGDDWNSVPRYWADSSGPARQTRVGPRKVRIVRSGDPDWLGSKPIRILKPADPGYNEAESVHIIETYPHPDYFKADRVRLITDGDDPEWFKATKVRKDHRHPLY
jgi:hypothetical protein